MYVHILLATYQGELFLKEQLDSILRQNFTNWTLLISDDGSLDGTLKIIDQFARNCTQRVRIISGPQKGATENFFHLINNAPIENDALYAFCDQDDVWYPDKLSRAVEIHYSQYFVCPNQAYLYCGRTEIVSQSLAHLSYGRIPKKPLGFGNALIQNIAGGNTMVFDSIVFKTLQMINPQHSVLHDWTTYQVVTGIGGVVFFDQQPCLAYRQHRTNLVGAAYGWVARYKRLKLIFDGRHKKWATQTRSAMADVVASLTLAACSDVAAFEQMCDHPRLLKRLAPFLRKRYGIKPI